MRGPLIVLTDARLEGLPVVDLRMMEELGLRLEDPPEGPSPARPC